MPRGFGFEFSNKSLAVDAHDKLGRPAIADCCVPVFALAMQDGGPERDQGWATEIPKTSVPVSEYV